MYIVYILRCGDDTLYTGIATNIKRRISEHRAGVGAKYTRGRGPFRLLYTEQCADRSTASRRELEIKSWNRKRKLQFITGE